MYRKSFVPIKEGDELDVTIEAVGEKGDGLAKKDGFVIFVPNTKQGDTVRIRITRVLRKVGFAEVVGKGAVAPQKETEGEEAAEATESEESEESKSSEESAEKGSYDDEEEDTEDSEDFGEEDE